MDDTGEVMGETNFVISEAFYYRIGKSVLFVDRKKMQKIFWKHMFRKMTDSIFTILRKNLATSSKTLEKIHTKARKEYEKNIIIQKHL